jgi:hypothetical protein
MEFWAAEDLGALAAVVWVELVAVDMEALVAVGRAPMPKMPFPRFDGVHPRVWRDKCHDYFRAFNISPTLWVTTATLHMDGNAAIWLQAFRQRHALGPWPTFIAAVESEFGADDQRQSMKALLSLKQQGTVDEYYREFQALMYLVTMHNPNYDEHFFVTQFIKGLKSELRNMVEAQVPDSMERAVLLARVQQEILVAEKPRAQRQTNYARSDNTVPRLDTQKPSLKLATGDFWKDRQLRDYRKANGLCFKCGDKFDPTHQCGAKPAAALNALETEPCPVQLSEEVLNMLELQDIATAEQLSLSINALAGSESANCLRLRCLSSWWILVAAAVSSMNTCSTESSASLQRGLRCR